MKIARYLAIFLAALLLALVARPGLPVNAIYAVEQVVAGTGLDESLAAIGYNSHRGEFLVIWQVREANGNWNIRGRRAKMNPEFAWLGSAFDIAADSRRERNPAVAYNSNDGDFLVVYEYEWSAADVDIRGQRVAGWSGAGDAGFNNELKGGPFGVAESLSVEHDPDVAHFHAGQNFLVVYTVDNATDSDIYAQRVARRGLGDGGGDLIAGPFAIADDFQRSEKAPAVIAVSQQSYYVVAYTYEFSINDFDVQGQRVRGLARLNDELLDQSFDIAFGNESEGQADLAYSPTRQAYLAVWTASTGNSSDVWGAWLDERTLSGSPLIGNAFAIAADPVAYESTAAVDVDPTRASSAPAVAVTHKANAAAGERLGLAWLDPDPRASRRLAQPLSLFPDRPFLFLNPVLEVCHSKAGLLLGYSARYGAGSSAQNDAHLLPTSRWSLVLPMLWRP